MEGESGCGHSSQVSQEQQGGSITNEPLTFPTGLLELSPGSLYVTLYQSLDDSKAVGHTLSFPRPRPCPRVGLQWKAGEILYLPFHFFPDQE